MGHTFTNNLYHIIFSVKGRRGFIHSQWEDNLHSYICGIVRSEGCKVITIGGDKDHIHLLARVKPSVAISDMLRLIKTNSSKWVKETYTPIYGFQWQQGYSCFSVSESVSDKVSEYIKNQKAHHKTISFKEELVGFFDKNGINYDPSIFEIDD